MAPTWIRDPRRPGERRRGLARTLRRNLTEPERRLWWHLRKHLPLEGTHFRRQVNVGRYIVDFCCLSSRLVIEVDGNQHGHDEIIIRDGARTQYLEERGFRVLRFSNAEVMTSMTMVLDTIRSGVEGTLPPSETSKDDASAAVPFGLLGPTPTTPTPCPFPQGGGE